MGVDRLVLVTEQVKVVPWCCLDTGPNSKMEEMVPSLLSTTSESCSFVPSASQVIVGVGRPAEKLFTV